MFELCATATVRGLQSPTVGGFVNALGAGREERLDGHDQAFPQRTFDVAVSGVRNARIFVDVTPHAVPAQIAHDAKPGALGAAFDGASDVF